MKKIILFIAFIIIYSNNYSQTYYPLVETNRIWSTLYQTDDTSSSYFVQKTEFVKFSIDTLIRGKFYKKIFKTNDSLMIDWKENGFIREDSLKKVYYLSNENSNEILIYDFNITINDTIKLPQFDAQLVVDSINYIEIGEHQRKQIYLSSSNGSEVWIEGIGSLFGVLNSGLGIPCGGSYHLLCFTENNNLLYQNNEFNTCYLYTDIVYETIVDTTKQWSVVTECYSDENYPEILSASTIGYRFRGDTIINSLHYSFLEVCVNDSLFKNWGKSSFLFRDDSCGRVYVHDYNQEILLYDYNVEVGDTIWIPYSDSSCMEIVDSVGTKIIAGKTRRVVYWWGQVLYAKGFGTYEGPLGLLYHCMVGDCGRYVSCFHQNDTLLYQSGNSCYVYYKTDIKEHEKKIIKIYPNPASNELTISFDKRTKAEFFLYNIYGKLLKSKQFFSNKTTLPLSGYSDGIYYYSIKSGKKIIKNGVLIIKK